MKATIDHLTYNTETAEDIASWDNGSGCTDFGWCAETLYRTKKGNYFIHGRGGASSGYSRSYGQNNWGGGEAIRPLTEKEALEWCEERGEQDAIDAHFSHLVEEA